MTKLMKLQCAPLISAIYARNGITQQEKEVLLGSIRDDPEMEQAKAILAAKLLEDPGASDIRFLYDKMKGE